MLSFALAFLASSTADVPPCEDSGPWPCQEDGCPSPTVGCAMLKGDCSKTVR